MPKPLPPPLWVIEDMVALSTVEPQLFPDPDDRQLMWHDYHPVSSAGGVYHRDLLPLLQAAGAAQIFIVPTLAETAALLQPHLAQAAAEGLRCAVVCTGSAEESTDADADPVFEETASVAVIPFGTLAADLPEEERLTVLVQWLQNSGARILHIIQCPMGWQIISRWARQLKQTGMRLHVTVAPDDSTPLGQAAGSLVTLFPLCARHLDALFSSSQACTATLQHREGYPLERILPLPGTTPSHG
jgi:hypothetical protein